MVILITLFSTFAFGGGHPANVCAGVAKVKPDGSVLLRIRFDILAFILEETPADITDGPMNLLLDGPVKNLEDRLAEAKERFKKHITLLGDGKVVSFDTYPFPTADEVLKTANSSGKQRLPVMMIVSLTGHLPKGTRTVSFKFPELLGTVILTTEFPYQEPVSEPIEPPHTSTALRIPTQKEVDALAAAMNAPRLPATKPETETTAKTDDKSVQTTSPNTKLKNEDPTTAQAPVTTNGIPSRVETNVPESGNQEQLPLELPQQNSIPWYRSFGSYLKLGFVHIIPEGLDHILFVLGLFLLSKRTKDLLKQITAFTIAHSLTLALALFGVIRLPASIVEPIIALSIAFVAIENLFTSEMKVWRPYVVFGFGLIHGLGFAGILQDLSLPQRDFLTALVGFNIGVEFGQLAVVVGALLLVGWFRSNEKYRTYVTMPASVLIAVTAIFWTVQRIFF